MNAETESSNLALPLALIACTIAILLASQVGATMKSADIMKWQSDNLEKQVTQMDALDKQAGEAIEKRKEVVKSAGDIQNQLQTLLNELLDLADKDKDKDAQEIIKKWNVQRAAPAGGAAPAAAAPAAPAAPAPAPEPAKKP
ncbi:MAG TPA: hypothetical protein VEO95_07380 [Chthoniobacteraceae bacterium]|nr:hypothetical protein [Chthoniobacteraceae bacterium]